MTPARRGTARDVLEPAAIGRGAAVAVVVCLPLAILGEQVVDGDEATPLAPLLFLAVLAGLAAGGFVAARSATGAPYTNGGIAALVAYVVIQGTALVLQAIDGSAPSLPAFVFSALLAFGCGLAGGALGHRSRPSTGASR